MNKNNYDPHELARIVAKRSACNVKVGAVIFDNHGIFAWGWNSSGPDGYGLCAERHAISRANRERLKGANIMIVALRKNREITSLPCAKCASHIRKAGIAYYHYMVNGKRILHAGV